jgi:hypothetical protein
MRISETAQVLWTKTDTMAFKQIWRRRRQPWARTWLWDG